MVVPVFGFANAGVSLTGVNLGSLTHMVPMGISVGLVVGKTLGVFLFGAAAINLGFAKLPERASWIQFFGTAALCGIGFTMSLFIGHLAFIDPVFQPLTKLGVLLGSTISAVLGLVLLGMGSSGKDGAGGADAGESRQLPDPLGGEPAPHFAPARWRAAG